MPFAMDKPSTSMMAGAVASPQKPDDAGKFAAQQLWLLQVQLYLFQRR
jgi:hypothetical protein